VLFKQPFFGMICGNIQRNVGIGAKAKIEREKVRIQCEYEKKKFS